MKLVICLAVLLTAARAIPLTQDDFMKSLRDHLSGLHVDDYHVEDDNTANAVSSPDFFDNFSQSFMPSQLKSSAPTCGSKKPSGSFGDSYQPITSSNVVDGGSCGKPTEFDALDADVPEETMLMNPKSFKPGHPSENFGKTIKYKRGNNGNGRMQLNSRSYSIPSSDPNQSDTQVRTMSMSNSFSSHHPADGGAGGEGNYSWEDNQKFFQNMNRFNPFAMLGLQGPGGRKGNPQMMRQQRSLPAATRQYSKQYSQPRQAEQYYSPQ